MPLNSGVYHRYIVGQICSAFTKFDKKNYKQNNKCDYQKKSAADKSEKYRLVVF